MTHSARQHAPRGQAINYLHGFPSLQDRLVSMDWTQTWNYLHEVVPESSNRETWNLLDDCRILPLADSSLHRMKERKRLFVLPEGASYENPAGTSSAILCLVSVS